jgi:glycosyltransferase involved in cell wall biosynthesis
MVHFKVKLQGLPQKRAGFFLFFFCDTLKAMLSLVVPCYNEEKMLPPFYEALCAMLAQLEVPGGAEVLFIDDGSGDGTLGVLRDLASRDARVHFRSFSRNFGKEAALLAGLQAAQGEFVVTMDADLQDPPELVPEMLAAVASGEFDCAGTRRVTRKGEPPLRSFFARRFYALMQHLADIDIVEGARDFRLMNRPYVDAVVSLQERSRFSKGIFPWVGFKTRWFEFENIPRSQGSTKWSFWQLFWYSLDGMVAFSTKPLALVSLLGVVLFLLSAAAILFIVVRKLLWGDPVSGWASTACLILCTGGIQLFATGILGQYLAKTYGEVKHRPHYLIREER